MSELTQNLDIFAIQKGLNLLGLEISELELNELQCGNHISLEGRGLSEIGSFFILAAALSASNLGKAIKTITFRDLPKAATESTCCSGIPLYCWNSDQLGKRCLYLTLVDGKPAVRTCCES